MRVTRDFPGCEYIDVYLNGVKMPFCLEADDVAGYAISAVLGENGRPTLDPNGYDGVKVELLRGTISFVFLSDEGRDRVVAYSAWLARSQPTWYQILCQARHQKTTPWDLFNTAGMQAAQKVQPDD